MSEPVDPVGSPASMAPFLDRDDRVLLLLTIDLSDHPVGVLQARQELLDAGVDLSESTVARRLRELDAAGLSVLLGKQGRVLTPAGTQHVHGLRQAARREEQIGAAVTVHSTEAFLDLWRVRRALEPEAAREATLRATPQDLADLRALNADYTRRVSSGGGDLGRDLALVFHRRLLAICRNPLLLATLEVALDSRLDRVEAAVDVVLRRHRVHEAGLRDHELLVDAMELRDARCVEELMRSHVDSMIAEVEAAAAADDGLLDRLLSWSPS